MAMPLYYLISFDSRENQGMEANVLSINQLSTLRQTQRI